MAFLRQTGQQQNNLLSGAGGIAGEGAPVGSKQKTAAGSPGSWYNIQDFLGANQQKPTVQNRIEEQGAQQLGGAQKEYQSQVDNLSAMPTANAYDQSKLSGIIADGTTGDEAQQLRGFLDQSFEGAEPGQQQYELSANEQLQGVANPFEGTKPGDFSSIMNWYGGGARPTADYTPGMQKMDEMLLRGQKGFAQQFPSQMQEQFQSQITKPMEQKRQDISAGQTAAKQSFSDEGKNWYEGISGFLGGEKQKVEDRYAKQQEELAKINAMTPEEVMGDYYQDINPTLSDTRYASSTQEALDPLNYVSRGTYTAPSQQSAARAEFSPEQLNTYNTLAGLVDQQGYAADVQYDPGAWSMDNTGFETDYMNKIRGLEEEYQQGEIDRINAIESTFAPDLRTQYDVPGFIDTKYGKVNLSMPEAGKTVYSPWEMEKPRINLPSRSLARRR